MKLKDGRQLAFAEFGTPHGKPVLYFHGLTGNRLDATLLHKAALLNDCRLISIDRPGIGNSSLAKARSFLSWVDDIVAFTDYLAIKKFSIVGHSCGAPYTAACAYKIPERLNGVAIVAGIGPFKITEAIESMSQELRFLNKAINRLPWISICMMKLISIMFKNPKLLKYGLIQMPEADIHALLSQESYEAMSARMKETFKHGVIGAAEDAKLMLKPWGFDLTTINLKCPITIWQGGVDKQAPITHAELFARLIPHAKLYFFKDEGHLSILINKGEEILRSVI